MGSSPDSQDGRLADFFFICGIDGQQLKWNAKGSQELGSPILSRGSIIQEETLASNGEDGFLTDPYPSSSLNQNCRQSKRSSELRLSKFSDDCQFFSSPSASASVPDPSSNRSSATIRPVRSSYRGPSACLNDDDFHFALQKFASSRDNFLANLSPPAAPASTIALSPEKVRARDTQSAQCRSGTTTPRSGAGSIRRRISARKNERNSRPTNQERQASISTLKRISNYNSVIPDPQPIGDESRMHPLMRKLEPVLLDQYPPQSICLASKDRRARFPDYVPMFAFPNDVHVVSSDERPRTTWHGFAMTGADNSRLHGICATIWVPLEDQAARDLESECELWRRNNMSDEEREFAVNLGERLALERVKLSDLLAKLSKLCSDSEERQQMEEQICAVEEKIALMAGLLRPVRHAAAFKIDGLTDGESGLWLPRVYGILGRDASLTSFWKEWLRSVLVPMTNGAILRVPISSPTVGTWQPLERYVVNLLAEAPGPISSNTQVELTIRDLKLYARREAANEIPGCRNTDLYPLFRTLSIENIVRLVEFVLAESRIILLSSHTAMLHSASKALIELIWPFEWAGVFIPVLPARLIQTLDAPCPYIIGVDRRMSTFELPQDDFVLIDLDHDEIGTTINDRPLPRSIRRKLVSLLQLAAPHHIRYGVPQGPPAYSLEAFPFDAFASENDGVFSSMPAPTNLAQFANMSSTSFGEPTANMHTSSLVFNAFQPVKSAEPSSRSRPSSASSMRSTTSPPSPDTSPFNTPVSSSGAARDDSKEPLRIESLSLLAFKRLGQFDSNSRRHSSAAQERLSFSRRPLVSLHAASRSVGNYPSIQPGSTYTPSIYAQSTLAASTILPDFAMQPIRQTESTAQSEGHEMHWDRMDDRSLCSICNEKAEGGIYTCSGCDLRAHANCAESIHVVCPRAFHPAQIRVIFARSFARLLFSHRKFLHRASKEEKAAGALFHFNMDAFIKSLPFDHAAYVTDVLRETQAFHQFIHHRETVHSQAPSIMLFDQIILAKRNRHRSSMFSKARTPFLSDNSNHIWRTASVTAPKGRIQGDYRDVVTRCPAKLDATYLFEPRSRHGQPGMLAFQIPHRKPLAPSSQSQRSIS